MRFITPVILLIISLLSFFIFTNPTYKEIKAKKVLLASYDSALDNAKELQADRDALSAKRSSLSTGDIKRLSQMLPDNADNIRLIIDLQRIGQAYGMTISSTKFDAKSKVKEQTAPSALSAGVASTVAEDTRLYGTFDLEFSTTATYDNFLKFLKDIESSLRLIDIQSIDFTSDVATPQTGGVSPGNTGGAMYIYNVKLRTYWLKG